MKKKAISKTNPGDLSEQDLYRVYSRCMNATDSAKCVQITKKQWTSRWKDLGLPNPKPTTFKAANEDEPGYNEIGILSDLHFGSLWQQKSALNEFCDILKSREIQTIVNAGDLTDGIMSWPMHEKERFIHSPESYVDYLDEFYPSGFSQNYFITGNHDVSLTKLDEEFDLGHELVRIRSDLIYHEQNDRKISKAFVIPGGVNIMLYHGNRSCSNPIMKQTREFRLHAKTLEMLGDGADNSDVYIYGHCHRQCLTSFFEKIIIGAPCFQETTPFALSRSSINDVGGMILKYNVDLGKIVKFSLEYFDVEKLGGIKHKDF